jgi:hypothetical protein
VEILFGFAWGNEIYPDPQWEYEKLAIEQVESRIRNEEVNQTGKLGDDDFYIQLSEIPLEIQLCHESDLHLWFEEKSPLVEEIFDDWKTSGFEPKEYIKENEKWIEPDPRPYLDNARFEGNV